MPICVSDGGDDLGRRDGRTVVRVWDGAGVQVFTVAGSGEVLRGRLRVACGVWEWSAPGGAAGRHTGDFLDAELALLAATAGLDEPGRAAAA